MVASKIFGFFIVVLLSLGLASAWGVSITDPLAQNYGQKINVLSWNLDCQGGINLSKSVCQYSLNGGVAKEITSCSCDENTITDLNSEENTNDWRIYVNNGEGTDKEAAVSFWVDSILPVVDFTNPITEYTNQNFFEVIWGITEDNKYDYGVNQFSKIWIWQPFGDSYPDILDATVPGTKVENEYYKHTTLEDLSQEGEYHYLVRVADKYPDGIKIRDNDFEGTIMRDTKNPEVSITFPLNGDNLMGEIQITVSASDTLSGIDKIDLEITDGGEYNHADSCSSENCGFFWNSTEMLDGTATITTTAYDKAGNFASDAINIEIDNTAPEISFDSPEAGVYNSGQTISISASDVHLNSIVLYVNGNPVANSEISPLNYDLNEEGNHIVYAVAIDSFGNSAQTEERNILIDMTPPDVNADGDVIAKDIFFQDATSSDALSEIASYQWIVEAMPGDCSVIFGSANEEDTIISATCDGNYILSLTVTDVAGNSALDTMNLLWDTSAPATTAEVVPEGWTNEDVEVTLNCNDGEGTSGCFETYYCVTNMEEEGLCVPDILYDKEAGILITEEGASTILFYSTDNAGNTEETLATEADIDKSGPDIEIIEPSPEDNKAYALGTGFDFRIEDSDNYVGTFSCTININGEDDDMEQAESWDYFGFEPEEAGKYVWSITCEDNLGNPSSTDDFSFTILSELENEFDDFTDLTAEEDISSVLEFFVENAFGKIRWLEALDFSDGFDWSLLVSITENLIAVDSATPELNKSAEITLYNLSFADSGSIEILRDGEVCASPLCDILSYENTTLIFNVTGFTNYSSQQGEYCGDASCNNGETCSSCSQDCGACSSGGSGGGGGGGCTTSWQCTSWTECSGGTQTRVCEKADNECIAGAKPVETQTCTEETEGTPGITGEAIEETTSEEGAGGFLSGITGAVTGAFANEQFRTSAGAAVLVILLIASYFYIRSKKLGKIRQTAGQIASSASANKNFAKEE